MEKCAQSKSTSKVVDKGGFEVVRPPHKYIFNEDVLVQIGKDSYDILYGTPEQAIEMLEFQPQPLSPEDSAAALQDILILKPVNPFQALAAGINPFDRLAGWLSDKASTFFDKIDTSLVNILGEWANPKIKERMKARQLTREERQKIITELDTVEKKLKVKDQTKSLIDDLDVEIAKSGMSPRAMELLGKLSKADPTFFKTLDLGPIRNVYSDAAMSDEMEDILESDKLFVVETTIGDMEQAGYISDQQDLSNMEAGEMLYSELSNLKPAGVEVTVPGKKPNHEPSASELAKDGNKRIVSIVFEAPQAARRAISKLKSDGATKLKVVAKKVDSFF